MAKRAVHPVVTNATAVQPGPQDLPLQHRIAVLFTIQVISLMSLFIDNLPFVSFRILSARAQHTLVSDLHTSTSFPMMPSGC